MISPEKTYQKVNKVRTKAGLSELSWDNTLAEVALQRAKEIYESDNWSHTRDGGKFFDSIIKENNVTGFDIYGENLARKFRNTDNMIRAWYKSPSHKKNMLKDYTDTGIATFGNVTVQLFGRRNATTTATTTKTTKKSANPRLQRRINNADSK